MEAHHDQAVEMAVLAQCKFNETRQHLKSLKSSGRGRGRGGKVNHTKQQKGSNVNAQGHDKTQELLSTLLYLATMLGKVDGMKAMLKNQDVSLYEEWRPLFDALSSPSTILREQSNQKERIKQLEKRKNHYKDEVAKRKEEATRMQEVAHASQSQLQDQVSTMSNTIAKLEGRLVEKEDTIKGMVDAQSVEKARLEDELVESKKGCESMQDKLSDLEVKLQEAREEIIESRALAREKDSVIEELRTESNERRKSLQVLQNELGKVAELENALKQRHDEISFLRTKLEASDLHQEELAKIIAQQQQQQQQHLVGEKCDPALEMGTTNFGKGGNTNKTGGINNFAEGTVEGPTVTVSVGDDDESVVSGDSRSEVATAKGVGKSEALELELRLCGEQYEKGAAESTTAVDETDEDESAAESSSIGTNVGSSKGKGRDPAIIVGGENVEEASSFQEIESAVPSSIVDGDDGDQAASLTSFIDGTEEHTTSTNIMTNEMDQDEPATVAQTKVSDAVEKAVKSISSLATSYVASNKRA